MVSPFPGMDPYLEGIEWSHVHHELASAILSFIAVKIAPNYYARIERYTVRDTFPDLGIGIMYPDVSVFEQKAPPIVSDSAADVLTSTPPTVHIPNVLPVEVRIPVIEIKDRANNTLITAIEILSPVNKRPPGLQPYQEKRTTLYTAGVNLLEIDLLRYGTHPFTHPKMPDTHYHITLVRADATHIEVWGFNVQDNIPIVPIPLKAPDADVLLDIRKALDMVYERGLFELTIDYNKTPPLPAFDDEEQTWMKNLLKNQ